MNKSKICVNILSEFIFNALLIAVQIAVVVLLPIFAVEYNWLFWVAIVLFSVSSVYFSAMFIYKLYRGRITFVTVSKDGIAYYRAFKRKSIPSGELTVALLQGDVRKSSYYAAVYGKEGKDCGFVLYIDGRKTLKKLHAFSPPIFINFLAACTESNVLESLLPCSDVSEAAAKELEARKENAVAEARRHKSKKR